MTRVTEWVTGIVGGIATFLGLFILLGGENQSVGIGGDLTWQVGEISSAWAYGLLIGGVVLLLLTLALVMRDMRRHQVYQPQSEFAGLMWHTGLFVVVNGFLWIQDIVAGGGLEYAYWVTIPWGLGLISHAVAYVFGARRVEEHRDEKFRQEEPRRQLQDH